MSNHYPAYMVISGISEMDRTLRDLEQHCMIDWGDFESSESRFELMRYKRHVKPIRYETPKPMKGLGFIETFKGIRYQIGNK